MLELDTVEMQQLGRVLRSLRLGLSLRQKVVAQGIGVDPSFVTLLERGQRRPSEEVLERLAEFFKVDTRTLLSEVRHEDPQFTGTIERLNWAWRAVITDPGWALAARIEGQDLSPA